MSDTKKSIFKRLLSGESVSFNDPDYHNIGPAVENTKKLSVLLNNETDSHKIRNLLAQIIDQEIDESTTVFTPFYTNYGKNIQLGKNVFINHACSFLDLGGITIEDDVMIAPRVNLTSEGHPISAGDRKTLTTGHIYIRQNVWIGANATIFPGVTVGKNSVVAAGAVVTKDVPDNVVVAGVPAKVVKSID
ncbi:sugar O-acetyltransferase [Euzebyella marina]|uniref:Sugar O-acetyltransferase n=1 Tax=Euzebyella marina TaxID=1761453 RepID=A0A3G2LAT6_9FLAO|nr:sugar O-acetyltransferase [Euzebyella marina]AYN69354.1 sugar O-acetyltransferase [Euzebyella marina]